MDLILGFITRNSLLLKVVGSIFFIIALYAAWSAFTGHYIDIGRAEIQEKWNKQIELDRQAAIKRLSENLVKESKTQQAINSITSNHQLEINKIRAKYDALQKDRKLADIAIDDWRSKLRDELAKSTARLSEVPTTAEGTTSNQSDSDTATLRTACQVVTSDYNALHDAWDKACEIHGCK